MGFFKVRSESINTRSLLYPLPWVYEWFARIASSPYTNSLRNRAEWFDAKPFTNIWYIFIPFFRSKVVNLVRCTAPWIHMPTFYWFRPLVLYAPHIVQVQALLPFLYYYALLPLWTIKQIANPNRFPLLSFSLSNMKLFSAVYRF